MKELFELIAITTIWVLGIKIVTYKGMILQRLGEYGYKKVAEGKRIFEPLFVCEWCMPSIHSAIGYMLVYTTMETFHWRALILYPVTAMGSSFTSGILWLIYKYYEKQELLTHLNIKNLKFKFNGSKEKFRQQQGSQEYAGAKVKHQYHERK